MKRIFCVLLSAIMLTSALGLSASAETVDTAKAFTYGDVNGDGKVNINDATAIQRYLAKKLDFSVDNYFSADYNGDTTVTINDCTAIQKKLVKFESEVTRNSFPVVSGKSIDVSGEVVEFSVDKNINDFSSAYKYNGDDSNFTELLNSYEEYQSVVVKTYPEYDEEFFKENSLIFLYRFHTTGSNYYKINGVTKEDGTLVLDYTIFSPADCTTDDLANWNIYISVKKSEIEDVNRLYIAQSNESYSLAG